MRQIRFRGKRKDNKKWIYGNLLMVGDKYYICWDYPDKGNCIEVIPETIGQYVNIKDKRGREIYEGDIIKVSYRNGFYHAVIEEHVCGYRLIAKFLPNLPYEYVIGCRCYGEDYYYYELDDLNLYEIEIIGNIHDNPELLTRKPTTLS